jgi:hypothetical protein
MTWLVWRQYRAQGAIALALLAAFAAAIVVNGFQIAARWQSLLTTCAGKSACLEQTSPLVSGVVSDLPYVSLVVPVAPLISRGRRASPGPAGWPSRLAGSCSRPQSAAA